ncbi:CoA pyrophosphatase [Georgenia yuyongxinii]|uniref:CoA pyrophosphatase n=1 Tax=Georgenia yuyongxinii TaxID=2589797 RepID=A0A5B8C602_9MICO|nr:CoA pyrophosphatase [Georgenia yuyongxinii]QDC25818.1 CoA pyrophosphatase [Georgenia yuyongxinii]
MDVLDPSAAGPAAGAADDPSPSAAGAAPAGGASVTARARDALVELGVRAAAGTFRPLLGVHTYDPAVAPGYRRSAVMILLAPPDGQGPGGADLFLVQRSPHLRDHPGQIALPGGRVDDDDADEAGAALRETHEEIGLPPEYVEVLGQLPPVMVPVSGFVVTPVLGWTTRADLCAEVDPGEVLHTIRVPVDALLDPAERATVRIRDHRSAGFRTSGGWVWGFTGNLLDHVFTELGWTREWDRDREVLMDYDPVRRLATPRPPA